MPAEVVLYDGNKDLQEAELRAKLPDSTHLSIVLGELSDEQIKALDLVILSPGVPTDLPVVNRLRDAGLRIWGEVELAWACGKGDVLAITGTNGKTTTTSLLGEIMKAWKDEVYVVGNIGTPYTGAAMQMSEQAVTVAEISSFQLETTEQLLQ